MRAYLALSLACLFFLSVEGERTWAQDLSPVPSRTGLPATGEGVGVSESEMVSPDTIQFPNNPVSDFLVVYEKLKGVTLIKDAS